MNINELFPSNFIKAADLKGQVRRVTIETVGPEEIAQGEVKGVCRFVGIQRGLILNRTNATLLSASFGLETTAWHGKTVELYPDKVMFQSRVVDAIRIRVPLDNGNGAAATAAVSDAAAQPVAATAPTEPAQPVTTAAPAAAPAAAPVTELSQDFDDADLAW